MAISRPFNFNSQWQRAVSTSKVQIELRMHPQRICEPKCISLWMYAMFFSVLLMFAIWPDWSEERIPVHPLWRSEGLWRGGESSSLQVSNTWHVWNCRFACFWVRVRCFWNFLLVLTCTLLYCMRSGALPWEFLDSRYAHYITIFKLVLRGCWTHIFRLFEEAGTDKYDEVQLWFWEQLPKLNSDASQVFWSWRL